MVAKFAVIFWVFMSGKKKILFLTGSINQTIQMHSISKFLLHFDCYFSQFFSENFFITKAIELGVLDTTIMGNPLRKKSEAYIDKHQLPNDYMAKLNAYDLVVFCSDMLFPKKFLNTKTIWVQEGMIDPYTILSAFIQKTGIPRYWSFGTSLNGTSNLCDIYCAASEGYKKYFVKKGTDENKIFVTGIPNYDHLIQHIENDFEHHGYVMVATTDMRETYRYENRPKFLQKCVEIAAGRRLLFKMHPNEKKDRAIREIKENCPENTLIYTEGPTNDMIANCEELITQYSTVVYTGIALGKKVHSFFERDDLLEKMPIQNGGESAQRIAKICEMYLDFTGPKEAFLNVLPTHIQMETHV
jgi:hypothetical protein